MKHAVGTRVKIVRSEDDNRIAVGAEGTIIGVGHTRYTIAIDKDPDYIYYPTEGEVEAIKKSFRGPMEQYGRILLPMLSASEDAPKMVYYSSLRRAVYMDKMLNTSDYFVVCVTRMLWNSDIQDYDVNRLESESFRLKQPSDMSEVMNAFNAFVKAHVNQRMADYADLLWQEG